MENGHDEYPLMLFHPSALYFPVQTAESSPDGDVVVAELLNLVTPLFSPGDEHREPFLLLILKHEAECSLP
jgi:hypothetical protein